MFTLTGVVLTKILTSPLARQSAYLDPGSGSFLIQLLIAAAAGLAFALRGYWSKIIKVFRSNDEDQTGDGGEQTEDD